MQQWESFGGQVGLCQVLLWYSVLPLSRREGKGPLDSNTFLHHQHCFTYFQLFLQKATCHYEMILIVKFCFTFSRILSIPLMVNLNNSLPQSDTGIIIAQGGGQGQANVLSHRQHTNTQIWRKNWGHTEMYPIQNITCLDRKKGFRIWISRMGLFVLGKFRWLWCNITQRGSGLISLIFTNPWSFKLLAPCHHHFSSPSLTHDKLFNNNVNDTLSIITYVDSVKTALLAS